MNNSYIALSDCYDRFMTDFDYDKYYSIVEPYIVGKVLELGIGSGEFTSRYIAKADKVIGVDLSAEMLNIAQAKLVKNRKKIVVINENIDVYTPDYNVDTILAICDTFNYIEDIVGCVSRYAKSLNIGGYLIFDISTEYKLRNIIGNNVFYEDYDDVTYLWTNSLTNNTVDMDLVIFSQDNDGKYTRSDDHQRQYIHNTNEIIAAISGKMSIIAIYNDEFVEYSIGKNSTRLVFICQK